MKTYTYHCDLKVVDARPVDTAGEWEWELTGAKLRQFHNMRPDDFMGYANFADYLPKYLKEGLVGSDSKFVYDMMTRRLVWEVSYTYEEPLGLIDTGHLYGYTKGQISDGIGEGLEQQIVHIGEDEYYISPRWDTLVLK